MDLINGRKQENEDVKIYCPTLLGEYYHSPWYAINATYDNDNLFFIEHIGDDEVRLSTMLEF